jgi:hypothetical protein
MKGKTFGQVSQDDLWINSCGLIEVWQWHKATW